MEDYIDKRLEAMRLASRAAHELIDDLRECLKDIGYDIENLQAKRKRDKWKKAKKPPE